MAERLTKGKKVQTPKSSAKKTQRKNSSEEQIADHCSPSQQEQKLSRNTTAKTPSDPDTSALQHRKVTVQLPAPGEHAGHAAQSKAQSPARELREDIAVAEQKTNPKKRKRGPASLQGLPAEEAQRRKRQQELQVGSYKSYQHISGKRKGTVRAPRKLS